ncbi:hypothetical protein MGN70_006164 [Eutypa lata]|nr:hypothetical protein MGN70_006164 [Eutypa lata]
MKGLLAFTAVAAVVSSIAAQTTRPIVDDETSSTSMSPSRTTSSPSSVSTSSSSSTGIATHSVQVGLDHRYNPDTIIANVGDKIEFTFYPQNHSVVKAALGYPCIPYNLVDREADIFFSGPMMPQGNDVATWTLQVNDTEPTYFYCSAPESCIKWNMVGVINPNDTHNLDVQKEFITNGTTKFQLSPGEAMPPEGEVPGGSDGDDSNDSGDGSTTPPSDDSSSSGGGGLAPGAIAGIAVGGAAVVIFAIGLVYVCGRKGGIEKGYRRSGRTSQAPPPMVEAHYVDDDHHHNPHHHHQQHGSVPSRYSSPLYDNMPKSPPPPSTYSSTYGGPPTSGGYMPPDPYNNNGHTSPHSSYMGPGGHPSPGHPPSQQHAFGSPPLGHHESLAPPPVELDAHSEPPRRELG